MPFKKPHQTADPQYTIPANNGYMIKPRGLNIIWGSDLRYWKITTEETAELIQVSWLEVSGKVMVNKGETYIVKFDVAVNANGFGWKNTDVLVMAKIGKKGSYEYKSVRLTPGDHSIPENNDQLEILVDKDEKDPELHFGLYEVWSGKWKGGLIIKEAKIIKKSSN